MKLPTIAVYCRKTGGVAHHCRWIRYKQVGRVDMRPSCPDVRWRNCSICLFVPLHRSALDHAPLYPAPQKPSFRLYGNCSVAAAPSRAGHCTSVARPRDRTTDRAAPRQVRRGSGGADRRAHPPVRPCARL